LQDGSGNESLQLHRLQDGSANLLSHRLLQSLQNGSGNEGLQLHRLQDGSGTTRPHRQLQSLQGRPGNGLQDRELQSLQNGSGSSHPLRQNDGHETGSIPTRSYLLQARRDESSVHRYPLRSARLHLPSSGSNQRLQAVRSGRDLQSVRLGSTVRADLRTVRQTVVLLLALRR
jgi:hypothetical protein